MSQQLLVCPLCGTAFDPADSGACRSCPLSGGCQLVCCPQCGYTTVDPARSGWARRAERLLGGNRSLPPGETGRQTSLAEAPVGGFVEILAMPGVPATRRQHLHAYGVTPGTFVRILQQRPMTVLKVEHTELALERPLARSIHVSQAPD